MRGHIISKPRRLKAVLSRFALGAGLVASACPALAQDATMTSFAVVRGETRITKLGDLAFGTILPGASGGTVVIAENGDRTVTGSVIAMGGSPQPASFNITRRFLLDYPSYEGPDSSDTVVLTSLSNPAHTMTLRNFTTDFNRAGFLGLPAYFFTNSYNFRIGGTLDVAANQPAGNYRGSFTVTIDYN